MGIFDKAGDLAKQHEDRIEAGIEQAGDFVDEKTGGKYAGQVDQA
ncbi:MAG TPA: antitoxin, partial [Tessaracoccus flavescens]|nr:antitoxin [Tessaracoccus flavescens]